MSMEPSFPGERRGAPFYSQGAGRARVEAGQSRGPGARGHYCLWYTLRGSAVLRCREASYDVTAGDMFLVYPEMSVQIRAGEEEPWEYIWAAFGGTDAAWYMAQTAFRAERPLLRREAGAVLTRMEALCQPRGITAADRLETTGRLYALLSQLLRTAPRAEPGRSGRDCAELAADYIAVHYAEPISVEALAAWIGVSQSSLYRSFVRRFSLSPKRYLLEYRVRRACELLTAGGRGVQELSAEVGFEDPFYFSRVFRKLRGVSPQQFASAAARREE